MLSSLVGTRFQWIQWGFVVFSCIRMLQYFVSLFGHFSLSMTAFVCNLVLGISLGNTSQGMLVKLYMPIMYLQIDIDFPNVETTMWFGAILLKCTYDIIMNQQVLHQVQWLF